MFIVPHPAHPPAEVNNHRQKKCLEQKKMRQFFRLQKIDEICQVSENESDQSKNKGASDAKFHAQGLHARKPVILMLVNLGERVGAGDLE